LGKESAGPACLLAISRSKLHAVKVLQRRVPVDDNGFLALLVWADHFLPFDFAVKATHQGFVEGESGVPVVWRLGFKGGVAVRASEDKLLGFSHIAPFKLVICGCDVKALAKK